MLVQSNSRYLLPAVVALAGLYTLAVTLFFQYALAPPVLMGLVCALPLLVIAPLSIDQAFRKVRGLGARLGWTHLCWLLLLLSGLQFRIRGVDSIIQQPLDFWALYRVALVGMSLLLIAAWAYSSQVGVRDWLRGLPGWLVLYAVVCLVSASWSVEPSWTLYKSAEYLTAVLVLAAIVQSASSTERGWGVPAGRSMQRADAYMAAGPAPSVDRYKALLDWTWALHAALLGTVWLGIMARPDKAILHGIGTLDIAIIGLIPAIGWNTVGEISAVLGIVCVARIVLRPAGLSKGALHVTGLTVALVTLVLSASRSSIAGFLTGTVVMLLVAKRFGSLLLVICGSLIVGLRTPAGEKAVNYLLRGQTTETFYSLSGRVQLWEYGMERLAESPVGGFGAYAGGRFVTVANFSAGARELSSNVLNTFLEVLLGTSIWGLIPLLIALGGTWWMLARHGWTAPRGSTSQALAIEALGVLGVITVRSFLAVKLVWHPALLFLAVLGCAEVLRRRTQLR